MLAESVQLQYFLRMDEMLKYSACALLAYCTIHLLLGASFIISFNMFFQVGGAMEELREWYEEKGKHNKKLHQAKERCAGGIVEALEKLSLGPHLSPRDRMNSNGIQPSVTASENGQPAGSGLAQREVVEFNTFFEKWMNGEVPNDSETFQRLTSVIVSFCSTSFLQSSRAKHCLFESHKQILGAIFCN